jgi:hypothetical protein
MRGVIHTVQYVVAELLSVRELNLHCRLTNTQFTCVTFLLVKVPIAIGAGTCMYQCRHLFISVGTFTQCTTKLVLLSPITCITKNLHLKGELRGTMCI